MKYPSIRKQQAYTVRVPQLDGGVNYSISSHLIEDNQLSDVKNMWYKDGLLRTRPGLAHGDFLKMKDIREGGYVFEKSLELGDKGVAICQQIHNAYGSAGHKLHFIDEDGTIRDFSLTMNSEPWLCTASSKAEDKVFGYAFSRTYEDGMQIYALEDEDSVQAEPYIPTVLINGRPLESGDVASPNGRLYEPYNMLSRKCTCTYTSDGMGIYYFLPETQMDDMDSVTVKYTDTDGEVKTHTAVNNYSEYSEESVQTHKDGKKRKLKFDGYKGCFWFVDDTEAVSALPLSAITNNVEITVQKKHLDSEAIIAGMKFSTWFGGGSAGLSWGTRLFVSGNSQHPNLVHWSALNDPLYFPENNYAYVGDSSNAVTAFGKQGDLLVIFKEKEMYCTQYVQGTVTEEEILDGSVMDIEAAVAVFPMTAIHGAIGCDCPDTVRLCNNRLVWLNSDGRVYGLFTTGQYNERNVRELSHCIRKKLKKHTEEQMKNASAAELDSYYLLYMGDTTYVMDYSSSGFTYYSSYSSDEKAQKAVAWYVWDTSGSGIPCEERGQRLMTVGKTPVLLMWNGSTITDDFDYLSTLLFLEGQGDSRFDAEGTVLDEKAEISCMFKTKLFEFDRADLKKSIQQLYLGIGDITGSAVRVSYVTEQWADEDAFTAECTGDGEEDEDRFIRMWRLTPNASRVRTFGIRCDSDGIMAVQGIVLKYQHQGVVR